MFEPFFRQEASDRWGQLASLQDEINRAQADSFPPLNIWRGEDKLVLTAELPGIDPNQLDISLQNNILTLRGQRQAEQLGETEVYHRRERATGQFVRSLELPYMVDAEKVLAEYRDGLLTVTLLRHESDKPRKINVKSTGKL